MVWHSLQLQLLIIITYILHAIFCILNCMQFFCYSSVLWTKYGLLKADTALVFVNSAGALMSIHYIVIYYIFTSSRVWITLVFSICLHIFLHCSTLVTLVAQISKWQSITLNLSYWKNQTNFHSSAFLNLYVDFSAWLLILNFKVFVSDSVNININIVPNLFWQWMSWLCLIHCYSCCCKSCFDRQLKSVFFYKFASIFCSVCILN